MYFRSLHHFLKILIQKNDILGKRKVRNSVMLFSPHGLAWTARSRCQYSRCVVARLVRLASGLPGDEVDGESVSVERASRRAW
jgi:hypothetical protein